MSGVTLVKRPAWTLWLELVSRESKGDCTVEESQRVRRPENLVSWMRALNTIKQDVEAKTGDARLRLRALAPSPDQRPTTEYLEAKKEYERHHAGRVRVLRGLEARLDECRYLLDHLDGATKYATPGYLITTMCRAEELLCRDDIDGALGVLRNTLHRAISEEQS